MPGDTSLLIKTIARPTALTRLLDSIRRCEAIPADWPILVADDSRDPERSRPICEAFGAELIPLPHDVGLSAGRNALVDACSTEFLVILDDDFIFTAETDCPALVEFVQKDLFDIAGGTVLHNGRLTHYEGKMWREGRSLCFERVKANGPVSVDITWNFFAARTRDVKEVRWDDRLKVCEHQAFFIRAKDAGLKVGYIPHVEVNHVPTTNAEYSPYRKARASAFFAIFKALYRVDYIQGSLT